jgi:Transmembrane secretion effector
MRVLGQRDFRNLFLGQAASTIGDRIVFVALALYVTDIGSPTDVGIVLAAATLPLVGFLLIGGVWADRLPRNRVMIVTDLVRFGLHALLAALIFADAVEIWHIVVIEALFGTAEAFFRPAYTGLVPQTVPEEMIQDAKAAGSTVETIAEFAGPALATALVLGLGAGWAFALDAATFLVSAYFLAHVRPRERGAPAERLTVLAELKEGYAEVRARAWIWVTVVAFAVALLLSFGPWTTLGPTIAENEYGSSGVFGLLSAAMGAGTMLGALLGFRWRPLHPMRAGFIWTLPWPAVTVGFALGVPLGVLVPRVAAAGVGLSLFAIWWDTALAERVPPHTLSRVSAYDWMGSLALLPLGYLLAGPLGEALGSALVLGVGSVAATLALAAGLAVRETWTLRRLEPV